MGLSGPCNTDVPIGMPRSISFDTLCPEDSAGELRRQWRAAVVTSSGWADIAPSLSDPPSPVPKSKEMITSFSKCASDDTAFPASPGSCSGEGGGYWSPLERSASGPGNRPSRRGRRLLRRESSMAMADENSSAGGADNSCSDLVDCCSESAFNEENQPENDKTENVGRSCCSGNEREDSSNDDFKWIGNVESRGSGNGCNSGVGNICSSEGNGSGEYDLPVLSKQEEEDVTVAAPSANLCKPGSDQSPPMTVGA